MKTFNLDTLRMIKKTYKRFISLVLIVLIGSGFMMGLMSSSTILKESMDKYNDDNNLQDLQLYSTYGFCADDVAKIRETDGVKDVFASRFVDTYAKGDNDKEIVVRVEELNRDVNKYEVYEGKEPKNNHECLLIETTVTDSSYKIGEKLKLYLNSEDELSNELRYDEYTIVGLAKSPAYTSKMLGASTLNNTELNAVVLVSNTNFIGEQYKTIYLTLDGADEYTSYTKAYKDYVADLKTNVEETAFVNQGTYRDIVVEKAQNELDENKLKFETEKNENEAKLADAKRQLDDAHITLVTYKAQITSLNSAISSLEKTVKSYQDTLDHKKEELGISDEQIQNKMNEIENIDVQTILNMLGSGLDSLINGSDNVYELAILQKVIDEANENLKTYRQKIGALQYQVNIGEAKYNSGLEEYNENLKKFEQEIEKASAKLIKAQQDIDALPEANWMILDRDSHYSSNMFEATCKQMTAIGYAFPLLFYLVAALVCMTTMTRLVDEQRGQIGIFRALGYTKKEVTGKYVGYAFLASLIGCVIGIIIGQILFPSVIYTCWRLLYKLPKMILFYPIGYVLISFLAFSLLMMLVTYLVVKSDLNEVPASLLRPKAPKLTKQTFIEKLPFIWDKLSFTSKITARNLIRYKSRFFMTVIGVAGCTGLLVVGFGIKDSVRDVVEIQYNRIFNYNYTIQLENDLHVDENVDILKADVSNETVVPFMSYSSAAYKDNEELDSITVEVMDTGETLEILDLRKTDKKTILNLRNSGVIVSEKYAKNHKLKKGDTITVESYNGVKADVIIADICEMYFQHYLFMSDDYYNKTFNEKVHDTSIAVMSNDVKSLNKDTLLLKDYSSTFDFSNMIANFENMIKALDLIILVIILAAGSLALVVLINLTQVNVAERTREIATLKVLGFRPKEVDSYIFKEILILSIIGGFVGMPLGLLEHHFVMNVINMDMVMFGMNITFFSYIASFLITFVFTIIVLLLTRKPLRKIEMVESLKSVE